MRLDDHKVRAAAFDPDRHSFVTVETRLPTNPVSGGPVLLVPKHWLRELPTLNASDWWESTRSIELRDELNADLLKNVKKKDIVRIARRHPEAVRAWVLGREQAAADSYDLQSDPAGRYQPGIQGERYARKNPITIDATNDEEFDAAIEQVIAQFKQFVEDNGGWRLLWDGDKPKPETAAQLLFLGLAKGVCEANNIVIDREVELGRGPVDFKFSSGYTRRALLEIKKVENGHFWDGLEFQLPSYLNSDTQRKGWFVAIRYKSDGVSKERVGKLSGEVERIAEQSDLDLRYSLVDARPKKSASKIRTNEPDAGVA